MKRTYAVIGLGRFGSAVASTLAGSKRQVIAIDKSDEAVQAVSDVVDHAVVGDATDEKFLRSLGMEDIDVAVVSIGESIEGSVLVVMLLKELGLKQIVAKAVTPLHGKVLENLGATKIVFPERDMAVRIANALISPNVLEFLELSVRYGLVEIAAPDNMRGRSLAELRLRTSFGVTVIGIRRPPRENGATTVAETEEEMLIAPPPDYTVGGGDILVLIGTKADLERFSRDASK